MSKASWSWAFHWHHGVSETHEPGGLDCGRFGEWMYGFGSPGVSVGSKGNDVLIGRWGNDILSGDDGHDLLKGGKGDDLLDGGSGRDLLFGGWGDDALFGGKGHDSLWGGKGDDTLDGGAGKDWLNGGWGDDTLMGGAEGDWLWGQFGDDVLAGGLGNDWVFGGFGDDVVEWRAGDGSDLVFGGWGNDTFDLLTSDDVAQVVHLDTDAHGNLVVTVDGDQGGTLRLHSIESFNLQVGLGGASIVLGAGSGDVLGDQPLTLSGGDDEDEIDAGGSNQRINVNAGAGNDKVTGGNANDQIDGGDGDDTIDGGGGDDTLAGGDGNDTIVGGQGNDTIDAGTGNDHVVWAAGDGNDVIDGGEGFDELDLSLGSATASTLNVSADTDGNVILVTDDGTALTVDGIEDITIRAAAAGSVITIGDLTGTDIAQDTLYFVGSEMTDALDASNTDRRIDAQGNGGDDVIWTGSGNDVLRGGAGDDDLDPGSGIDRVFGDDGDDVIHSTLGDDEDVYAVDIIDGGAGNDQLVIEAVEQTEYDVFFNIAGEADGSVTIDSVLRNSAIDFDTETLSVTSVESLLINATEGALNITLGTLSGTALAESGVVLNGSNEADFFDASDTDVVVDASGNGGDDVLIGGSEADLLDGGAGNDSLTGSAGDDVLIGGAGDDIINGSEGVDTADYSGAGGAVTVDLEIDSAQDTGSAGMDTLISVEVVEGSAFDDTLSGGGGEDDLRGNDGNDTLNGRGGADVLAGGSGDDTLDGGAGADVVDGGDGSDTVRGGDGDDLLLGGDGDDTLEGGAGDDELVGGIGDDVLDGGDGLDTVDLSGLAGAVSIDLGSVAPQDVGSQGFDTFINIENLIGTSFGDVLTGDGSANVLLGLAGDDTLSGGDGADTLDGGDGADTISGGDGDDEIVGGEGDDELSGGSGGDTFVASAPMGHDTIADFSTADDVIDVTAFAEIESLADILAIATQELTASPSGVLTATTRIDFDAENSILLPNVGIANLAASNFVFAGGGSGTTDIVGTDQPDSLFGTAGVDSLFGLGGNDTLVGLGGADLLDGGDGFDLADYSGDGAGVIANLSDGDVTVGADTVAPSTVLDGSGSTDTLSSIERIQGSQFHDTLIGGAGDDELSGLGGDDVIDGGDGADILGGGDGADVISGGAGNDIIWGGRFVGSGSEFSDGDDVIDAGDGDDTVLGGPGVDFMDGGAGIDLLDLFWDGAAGALTDNLEITFNADGSITSFNATLGETESDIYNFEGVLAGSGNDVIIGNDNDNFISGGGGLGSDVIDGAGGVDTLILRTNSTADLESGEVRTSFGDIFGVPPTSISSIENVIGSFGDDTLLGDAGNNVLEGGEGNDILNGRGGDDTLNGGSVTLLDHLTLTFVLSPDGGIDTVDYSNDPDAVTVDLATGTATDGYGGTDTLMSIENATGSAFGDQLTGDGGDNLLAGLDGADTLDGGAGDDTLRGGAGIDDMDGGDGFDTVDFGDDPIGDSAPGLEITFDGTTITSFNADLNETEVIQNVEAVEGSRGNDVIIGDGGDNWIAASGGDDEVHGNGGTDTLSFVSAADVDIAAGIAFDSGTTTFDGIENIVGSNGADILRGDAGNNVLSGLGGDDLLLGREGGDTLDGGAGIDTVDYSDDGAGVTADLLAGTAIDGDGSTDTLIDVENLIGTAFADALTGNDGDNTIDGRGGNDVLSGGGGFDSFVLSADETGTANFGHDVVADFSPDEDVINLRPLSDIRDFATISGLLTQDGADALLEIDASNSVRLLNVNVADLGAGQFNFVQNLILNGTDGNDLLIGDDGDDLIFGFGGFDELIGGAGNDTLDGGADYDLLDGGPGDDTLTDPESGELIGGPGNDTLDGDLLYERDPSGIIANLSGNDLDVHGDGSLIVLPRTAVDGYGDIDTLAAGAINISATYFDDYVAGSEFGQSFRLFAGDDTALGLGGDDWFSPGSGNDFVDGGEGWDHIDYNADLFDGSGVEPFQGITVNLGSSDYDLGGGVIVAANSAIDSYGDTDALFGIEGITGTPFDDVIIGADDGSSLEGLAGDDTLVGGAGFDSLRGGEGDDFIDGGAGIDRVDYWLGAEGSGVTVDLAAGQATDNYGNTDTIVNVEEVHGSQQNDVLTGDSNDNAFFGGEGDDIINGGDGQDWLDGQQGNDEMHAGDGDNDGLVGFEGDDLLDGGAGEHDRAHYDPWTGSTTGIVVDLSLLEDSPYGPATIVVDDGLGFTDYLIGIEDISATDFDDTLIGNAEDNNFEGFAGNDMLIGGAGDDHLDGADDFDTIDGGDGNDFIVGGENDDLLTGGAGNDVFNFSRLTPGGNPTDFGVDRITDFSVADDTLDVYWVSELSSLEALTGFASENAEGLLIEIDGLNSVQLDGLTLHDLPQMNIWFSTIRGTDGDDVLVGTEGSDIIEGFDGNDVLSGLGGHDSLDGGPGDDTLIGGEGDDGLRGGQGNDDIDGGAGWDHVNYDEWTGVTNGVVVDLAAGTANDDGFGGIDTLTGIESVSGSQFADSLTGNDEDNNLYAEAGDDIVSGAAGHDHLEGGPGNDTLSGGDGDDHLSGGEGDDVIDGGPGRDHVSYFDFDGTSSGVVVDLAAGTANDDGFGGVDTLIGIEGVTGSRNDDSLTGDHDNNDLHGGDGDDIVAGRAGNDFIDGGSGNDTLSGGDGDDNFSGQQGDDVIDGGTGWDHVHYDEWTGVTNGVVVDLAAGTANDDGFGGIDTLSGIEAVSGSQFADSLTGDAGANSLFGEDGDDVIVGGAGGDHIEGGAGSDTLTGGAGNDWFAVTPFAFGVDPGFGHDVITDFELNEDTLDLSRVPQFVDLDALLGASSQAGDDVVIEIGPDDSVTLLNFDLARLEEADIRFSPIDGTDGDDVLNGTDGDNVINGFAGNDVLNGLGGNDDLHGGDGDDTLNGGDGDDFLTGDQGEDDIDGGAGWDHVNYNDWTGVLHGVVVDLDAGQAADDGFGGTDTLTGIESVSGSQFADSITGDDGDNILSGHDGDDILSGAGGNDFIDGGPGNDTLDGGDGDNNFVAGEGNDTVNGGVDWDHVNYDEWTGVVNGIVVDLAAGTATDDGFGGTDTLNGVEAVSGTQFADALTGDANGNWLGGNEGNDTLDGGAGDDTLVGGDGDDLFIFADGDGIDFINDFAAGAGTDDVIDLQLVTSLSSFAEVQAAAVDDGLGNTVIDLGGGNQLTLSGVDPAALHQDDFLF